MYDVKFVLFVINAALSLVEMETVSSITRHSLNGKCRLTDEILRKERAPVIGYDLLNKLLIHYLEMHFCMYYRKATRILSLYDHVLNCKLFVITTC